MDKGYIKLYRNIWEDPLFFEEKFSRVLAWIDLLMLANHKPSFLRLRGIQIKVDRGQVARTQDSLADRWKWSRGKVIRFLKELEKDEKIVQQKGQQNSRLLSVISIINYEKWQSDGTTNSTTNGQQTVQQTDTYNNVNNENKNKKDTNVSKKEIKTTYGYYQKVKLTDSEYSRLISDHGQSVVDKYINRLDEYIEMRGDKYKSHNATIRNWIRNDKEKTSDTLKRLQVLS